MKRLLIVMVATLVVFVGCKDTTIHPSDVVGTWILTGESREFLPPDFKKISGKIAVNMNGTFTALELPESLSLPGKFRLDSGEGVWKLMPMDGEQSLQLNFDSLNLSDSNVPHSYGFPVRISREWSGVTLYYYFFNPSEERLELTKLNK